MDIKELVEKAHETAVQHGFWEPAPELGTSIALIHSELSEVLEEARAGKPANENYYECRRKDGKVYACQGCVSACLASKFFREACGYAKPCGIPSELADAVIRIADLAGALGIDLDAAIGEKMAFNENRPYKHGKRF